LGQIITAVLPVVLQLIEDIVPLITELIKKLLPPIIDIITTLAPLLTDIITAILPVLMELFEAILPIIMQLVETVLPIFVEVIEKLLPPIIQLIEAVLPILMELFEGLMPIIQLLAGLFSEVLGEAIEGIKPIIDALMVVFEGLIDFITGVFSGDWGKAWEGVKKIFKGIVDGLAGVFKLPINCIIAGINLLIGGLNKLKIPDWVPGIGGNGFNIPLIPKLEKGSNYTPDTFIAGDVGGKGGELITGARGRKVFTAAETTNIFQSIKRAKEINATTQTVQQAPPIMERAGKLFGAIKLSAESKAAEMPQLSLPSMPSGSEPHFNITYNPTIYVDGDKPEDLEDKLRQNNETLLEMVKELWRREREDRGRMEYA